MRGVGRGGGRDGVPCGKNLNIPMIPNHCSGPTPVDQQERRGAQCNCGGGQGATGSWRWGGVGWGQGEEWLVSVVPGGLGGGGSMGCGKTGPWSPPKLLQIITSWEMLYRPGPMFPSVPNRRLRLGVHHASQSKFRLSQCRGTWFEWACVTRPRLPSAGPSCRHCRC